MTAEAGGIDPVPLKMTGKLMYLMIEFGHLREIRYPIAGQIAPIRKKKTRPLETQSVLSEGVSEGGSTAY